VERDLIMPMPGHHNALNATAAIAVAYDLGMPVERIRAALAGFGGVKRRFTRTGEWNGVADLRRLWPPPGRDRRRAASAASASTSGQGRRHRPAAPLHAARLAVRRVLHLLQRRRRR
jgi:hypothetical protein